VEKVDAIIKKPKRFSVCNQTSVVDTAQYVAEYYQHNSKSSGGINPGDSLTRNNFGSFHKIPSCT